ncbi:uncharacterized protein [Parasteatoda tepidariorum]|uniref:uncharacterized protein n=1 Tax=Parasteatoda tepidariorum TaxID=114398 RepID=UPI00077FAD68|nr:uncharacterized protein LOC107443339 [Parasteatoda tepidariorum]
MSMRGWPYLILVPIIISLSFASLMPDNVEFGDSEISKDSLSALRQMLIQNMLRPKDFDDSLVRIREAGPKRAHARRFDQLPPGFVGVRGKKSEKSKIKEPVPGFLGVRGKKSHQSSYLSNEEIRSQFNNRRDNAVNKCIQNELAKVQALE